MFRYNQFRTLSVLAFFIIVGVFLFISSCEWLGLKGMGDDVYSDTLRISIHQDLMDPMVLDEFEKEFEVYLDIDYHDSNEELFFPPRTDFDLVMVDQFIVQEFTEYFQPINQNNIPNRRYLDYKFTTMPHDFGLQYSFPVFWGSFGLAYSETHYSGLPLSWKFLFEPDLIHRGYISLLNDERYILGTALLYLGYSPNSTNIEEVLEAAALIEKAKYFYRSFSGKGDLIKSYQDGEITAFAIWSGTATRLKRTYPHTRFILPSEGALFFLSSFVIMNNSEKYHLAEQFINFNIDPERIARHTNFSAYANTIPSSTRFIDRRITMGPSYIDPFITHASYKLDAIDSVAIQMYNAIWDSLKTSEFEGYAPPAIYEFN